MSGNNKHRKKIDIVWDMETSDPDDFLTLILLLGHPDVNLKAVTITPGSAHQVGMVRKALTLFGKSIPVGAYNLDHPKECVSPWHYTVMGETPPSRDALPGWEVMLTSCDENTTLVTGAPLKNLGEAIKMDREGGGRLKIGRWVAQGGFAGEGVVPDQLQLDKFRGKAECDTYNLNGDPKSALDALKFEGIGIKRFVSKNVCHGVYYDQALHDILYAVRDRSLHLKMIWECMDFYLQKHPDGKKFHDPLAACCAIDESIGTWAEVELYRVKGHWGARLSPGSNTWIIIDYDRQKFIETLIR